MDDTEKLEAFLTDLGLQDKVEKFRDEDFDMSNIAEISDKDLEEYGITKGKRKNFFKAVKALQQKDSDNGSKNYLDPNQETQHSRGYSRPQRSPPGPRKPKKNFSSLEVPRIILMGTTGCGKSSLGNLLLGYDKFVVSNDPRSCTEKTSDVERGFWRGHEEEFEIIDSPGLNDSEGRDTDHIANIVEVLKSNEYVNSFVIVRNGQDPRLSRSYADMFRIFEMALGVNFWNHVVFDVSRGGNAHGPDKTHKRWIEEIKSRFPNAAKAKFKTVYVDVKEQDEELEENLHVLWNHIASMPQFECKNVTAVMEEKDKLACEKAELEKALVEERKTFQVTLETEKAELEKVLVEERKTFEDTLANEKAELQNKKQELEAKMKETTEEKEKIEQSLDEERKKFEEEKLKDRNELDNKMNEQRKKFEAEKLSERNELDNKINEERKKFEAEMNVERKTIQKDLEERNKADMERNKADMEKQIEHEKLKIRGEIKNEYDQEISQLKEQVMKKNHEIEKLKMFEKIKDKECREKEEQCQKYEKHLDKAKTQALEDERKMKAEEKIKIGLIEKKVFDSENDFRENNHSLFSDKGDKKPAGITLVESLKKISDAKQRVKKGQVDVNIPLIKDKDIENRENAIAARIFKTKYPSNVVPKGSAWFNGWFSGPKKTLMLLGLTGTGKTTFIDAFVNYLFDIRYEDTNRLRLIEMTRDERAKKDDQAQSQTDHIVVYHINAIPNMKISFDLTIIDTPGFGDTRGIGYDKKLMQNIEDLFKSKKIESLDAIGFVAKAGDARLTAQQKYIFESVLHIFGKDVEKNLFSILTCYDGMTVNILDSFEEADMHFVANIPVNSAAIFQHNDGEPVTLKTLEKNPSCINYHAFFKSSELLVDTLASMKPKSLDQTLEVLKDREHIEVEMQGLHHHVKDLLIKKDMIAQESDICKRHEENANATADTEYEVEEQNMKKVELPPGTYVTNCLVCNRTCHFPCGIPNDNGKSGCAAMTRGTNSNRNDPSPQNVMCSVCPKKCHWSKHVNNPYKIEFEVKKVKKTYDELVKRHTEFIAKHKGKKTAIDALKNEADDVSKEIQGNVNHIIVCVNNLKQNALRPNSASSSDYIEEMISAEDHEKKPGYQARIKQLREEKDKADYLTKIQAGANPDSL